MAANADDERYYYAEHIGDTIQLIIGSAGVSEELRATKLEPGRYILRVLSWGSATSLWVRMGPTGNTTAAAAAPSTMFVPPTDIGFNNYPLLTFMVHAGKSGQPAKLHDMLAFFAVAGTPTVQVTKISRGNG